MRQVVGLLLAALAVLFWCLARLLESRIKASETDLRAEVKASGYTVIRS